MTTINLQNNGVADTAAEAITEKRVVANVVRSRSGNKLKVYMTTLFVFIVAVAIFQFSFAGKIATYGYEISYMQNTQDELLTQLQSRQVRLAEAITLESLENELSGLRRVVAQEKTYINERFSDPVAYNGW